MKPTVLALVGPTGAGKTRTAIALCDALRMASETPGTLMGLSVGKIQRGYRADFVLLNGELFPEAVFVGGKKEKE